MRAPIEFIAETGSTNADLAARIASGEELAEGHWLVADRQIAGKGRQGRAWLDAPGNFMGSTLVHIGPSDPPAAMLSLVAALALFETVLPRLANPAALQLKWPNDVLLEGAKFSGILLERTGNYAVIGIGVNLTAAPDIDGRRVKSLSQIGPAPARDNFAHDLARQMAIELKAWREFGSEGVRRRWLSAAHPAGTPLSVHDEGGVVLSGRFDGIEPDGALRLRLADGACRVIHAGDVMQEES